MRPPFRSIARLFTPAHARTAGRSHPRRLQHESLTPRFVLSATPLAEIAGDDLISPHDICVAEIAVDHAEETQAAEAMADQDLSLVDLPDPVALDAALAEITAEIAAAEGEFSATPEAETSLPETWQPLEPAYPVHIDSSTALASPLEADSPTTGDEFFVLASWDSEGEGEFTDPMDGMDPLPPPEEPDPWDEPMADDEATGPFLMSSFIARYVEGGGWMLEGYVDWPQGDLTELTVFFGGIASGETSVYSDGFFAYYFRTPPGWHGEVTAQAMDVQGFTSNTLSDYIWL